MSQFSQVLILRNALKHTGQSLWKYDLSDNEFFHLKKNLCENKRLNEIDSRDCALYYAEWWKRSFNGGIPSKKDVYTTIANGQWYDEEEFFQHAKKGARLLGIQWIKNQNILYFRTLLLQGGIPIKHISNNRGAYKNFLLKILELNPNTIDDFAFNPSITSLLPKSSRNDEIYDCCLNIVRAIINEDEEYLNILDNNADLREISNELRIKKQSIKFESRKSKFRTTWVFEPESGQISLYLGFFEMTSKDFRNLFLKDDSEDPMDYEYKLYYDNDILCKFIKKANGQFMPIWVNKIDLLWNGSDQFLNLFLTNSNGDRYECKNLISHMPQLYKPSLWTKYSDSQWILEKGSRTSQEEGFVLFPDDYIPELDCFPNNVTICGKLFKWISFTNSIIVKREQENCTFKSNCKKIEWYILDENPKWLLRANCTVVRSKPTVLVYDENGNIIQNVVKKWRQKPGVVWNSWNGAIPHGLIEMQIQAGDIIEHEEFFNISLLELKIKSNSLHEADIELVNNDFLFDIYDNDLVKIEKMNSNKICLSLKTKTSIPNAIQATLKIPQQNKSLRFEISPPFKGMEIIDNNQNIVVNGTGFNLENLSGYRLMSNNANLSYHLYNTKRKKIIITERFLESFYPLRNFEDKINQLYTLSDSMDGDAEIALEIYEGGVNKQTKIKEYRFQRYNQKIHWSFDENKSVVIDTSPLKAELFAIPLDCKNEEINLLEVENIDGKYLFIPIPGIVKYIIFSDKESSAKMQPSFISIDPENEMTTIEERLSRVMCFSEELLNSEYDKDIWQRFLSYYKICCNNDLSYATFDVLRSVGYSSSLATKAFVFLVCFDDNQLFVEQYCKKMEGDLGFSFHWANKEHWAEAMEWIGCYSNLELMKHISSVLKFYFTSHHPYNQFKRISDFVLQNKQPVMENGYFLNGKINDLRTSLGEKVLSQLPQTCPKIPDLYKQVIPVYENSAKVKVLLKSPLAVALSIAGKDDSLWNKDNEYIRRNVKYSYQLSPDWYSEAINYSLSKI